MNNVVGIDSRALVRTITKKDGKEGHFESIVGIGVKVNDYIEFDNQYQKAMKQAFSKVGYDIDYKYYCFNDLRELEKKYVILDIFAKEISKFVDKVHVFYTLFSKKRLSKVKVYGRLSRNKRIKLSNPYRTYEKLRSQYLVQYFPAICAWRLMEFLNPKTTQFHFDAYGGHLCEAHEKLEGSEFIRYTYTNGDCSNPVISTSDLLIELLDRRLAENKRFLCFDNIRPSLPEFGDKVLVYPISNKHLPFITPIDAKPINTMHIIKHPVFWMFKAEELLDTGTVRRSKTYRNLIDFASCQGGVVKMFDKSKDIKYFREGDFGVYINTEGKEIIDAYKKLGKEFKPFKLDFMVPKQHK